MHCGFQISATQNFMSYPQVWSTFKIVVNQDWFTDFTSSAQVYRTREMQCLLAEKGGREGGRQAGREERKKEISHFHVLFYYSRY